MSRKPIIAGNWKMNNTASAGVALVEAIKPLVKGADCDVAVCVPAIDIPAVSEALKGSNIALGAQNVHFEPKGAFTGEISAETVMAYPPGIPLVIPGELISLETMRLIEFYYREKGEVLKDSAPRMMKVIDRLTEESKRIKNMGIPTRDSKGRELYQELAYLSERLDRCNVNLYRCKKDLDDLYRKIDEYERL